MESKNFLEAVLALGSEFNGDAKSNRTPEGREYSVSWNTRSLINRHSDESTRGQFIAQHITVTHVVELLDAQIVWDIADRVSRKAKIGLQDLEQYRQTASLWDKFWSHRKRSQEKKRLNELLGLAQRMSWIANNLMFHVLGNSYLNSHRGHRPSEALIEREIAELNKRFFGQARCLEAMNERLRQLQDGDYPLDTTLRVAFVAFLNAYANLEPNPHSIALSKVY